MKKNSFAALFYSLYIVPYVFLGMYCQWIDYGLFMTGLTLLSFVPPFVYAYFCAKKGYGDVLIWGNIITFITSLIPTVILNSIGLTDALGGSWYGTFKPFNSIQMLVVCSVISVIVQSMIYIRCKKNIDNG